MKTNIRKIVYSNLERAEVVDPPYIVIGNTPLTPAFRVTMSVKGLKDILSIAKEEDSLEISINYGEEIRYAIIRKVI